MADLPNNEAPQTPLEAALIAKLAEAKAALDTAVRVSGADMPISAVRAAFLRRFLLEMVPAANAGLTVLEMADVSVAGPFDLEGAKLAVLCRFTRCAFPAGVRLDDSEIGGIEFLGSRLKRLSANRLTASGSVACRAVATVDGAGRATILRSNIARSLELCGAKIRGNLDLRGCDIDGAFDRNEGPIAILADGMAVEGSVLLSENFRAQGEVRLNGCQISRNLDCTGAALDNVDGFSLSAAGAHVMGSLYLGRSEMSDTNRLERPFTSRGEFRIAGAQIDGNVDGTNAVFTASCFADARGSVSGDKVAPDIDEEIPEESSYVALNADGVKIGSDLNLAGEDPGEGQPVRLFRAVGQVSLVKAKIGGDFICADADLDLPGGDSLHADGISVGESTYLGGNLTTNGFLRFAQATFEGGLYLDGINFDCDARRRFAVAVDHADDTKGGRCGLYAPCATVHETLVWQGLRKLRNRPADSRLVWVQLASAGADEIQDEEESWRQIDRFNITRCTYASLSELTGDIRERLDQLDRQYALLNARWYACRSRADYVAAALRAVALPWFAFRRAVGRSGAALQLEAAPLDPGARPPTIDEAIHRFTPQPYLQLAKVVANSGFEAAARKILVRLEYNMTMYGDLNLSSFLSRQILGVLLNYGYAPFRPVRFLVVWFLFSLAVFQHGYDRAEIQPTPQNVTAAAAACPNSASASCLQAPGADAKVSFNAFVFSLETLVPFIDLDQKKNWTVEPLNRGAGGGVAAGARESGLESVMVGLYQFPNTSTGILLLVNALLGWATVSFTAAAVTGLLRRSTDSD